MKKMVEKSDEILLNGMKKYLPVAVNEEIRHYLLKSGTSGINIEEIRLRSHGPVALCVRGRNVSLDTSLSPLDLKEVFKRICDGAVFAHRDDVCRGFVSLEGGVRVGVCGHARYENGAVVGISDICSLVFRLPTSECSFAKELYDGWQKIGGGMLICSPAGQGKTTAIRTLARLIGSGERARRVVVVDERCEFLPEGYRDAHVDILRGYRRALGVDIAIRTMSAEVIVVDEISSHEDAAAMLSAIGAGASVIATVHACDLYGAMQRGYVRELIDGGLFRSVCRIKREGDKFSFLLDEIDRKDDTV